MSLGLVRSIFVGLGALGAGLALWRWFMPPSAVPPPRCSQEFTAGKHGGARPVDQIRLVVMHSTDPEDSHGHPIPNPTALSTARYFDENTTVPASTQFVVGEDGCWETLPDDIKPYGAGEPANQRGIHVEQAGHYFWTRPQWLSRDATLRAAGGIVAEKLALYGLPLHFVDADELVALNAAGWPPGKGGVTTHRELSKAFPAATNHQDPGPDYPLDVLFRYAGGSYDGPVDSSGGPIA